MEKVVELLLTALIYAPIPFTILWLLIGAAFSKSNRQTQTSPLSSNEEKSDESVS